MPWVVKAWKPEAIAEAEREARRIRRAAGREAADADAYLVVLEDLGAQLREAVRCRRRERLSPAPLPIPARRAAPPQEIRASRGRASLRDSPLGDLFRATS